MSLISRIVNKIRHLSYTYFLRHFGFGNRVSRDVWEKQFGSDTWDYLDNKDEEEHYRVIVKMFAGRKNNSSVLDVGCGKGVLFRYLKPALTTPEKQYTGIDISQNAVSAAAQRFPGITFQQLDFDKSDIDKKFDVIIFNETLYYFNRPLKTLEKCVTHNLNAGGAFIISMCDYAGHDNIWSLLAKNFNILSEEEVINSNGQNWKIKLLTPINEIN